MPMHPSAKKALSTTIRALRAHLLDALGDALRQTYRLDLPEDRADLPARLAADRAILEAHLAEQARARGVDEAVVLGEVVDQAASTWINRGVMLRLMEAQGLRGAEPVLTGGWESTGYRSFREVSLALATDDDTEGYRLLLQLVFDELALDLPGLFGPVGLTALVPMPAATLRHLVEALNDPALDGPAEGEGCFTDDMTLGWVYQYYNDPAREALDDKIHSGGKLEPHELASKTQMFTERYMVDWLLQNTLGPTWLAMCAKHGWTPEVVADGTLQRLAERREAWRRRREAGEVAPTDLMPLHSETERRWAYLMPAEPPADAAEHAPDHLADLRLLDPACGSGHFLVVATDLLFALYQEEARHRGRVDDPAYTPAAIATTILERNLHGVDLDPRAVQIAAAALWLKATTLAGQPVHPRRLHLVAPTLHLAGLDDDDDALTTLLDTVHRETGLPRAFARRLVAALDGAHHLGTLLRVDATVAEALTEQAARLSRPEGRQGRLFVEDRSDEGTDAATATPADALDQYDRAPLALDAARERVAEALAAFLARHSGRDDLGLRLAGEQLAAGVRFLQIVAEGRYHVVVGNPPYQGSSRIRDTRYLKKTYPRGKADLYAVFLERALQLCTEGGWSGLLTMRNWMFIKQYKKLRTWLLETYDLRALLDLSSGAFEEINGVVVSVTASVFRRAAPADLDSLALKVFDEDTVTSQGETDRKRAATLAHVGRTPFDVQALKVVPEWPVVYWWSESTLNEYGSQPKLGDHAPVRNGLSTQNNTRYLRLCWEVLPNDLYSGRGPLDQLIECEWALYIKGSAGRSWFEDARDIILWRHYGLEVKLYNEMMYGSYSRTVKNESRYFHKGVAFALIGNTFSARIHRFRSVFGHMGASVFPGEDSLSPTVCLMNSARAESILGSLNPGVHYLVGDVNRLPLFPIPDADAIVDQLDEAFTVHESHREPSVEFREPGPSPWEHAQAWAQEAVDRDPDAPLPAYTEVLEHEPPTDHVSYALGVALGRFHPDGEGILDPRRDELSHALPGGILFLDGAADADAEDSLGHPAAAPLHAAWAAHGEAIDAKRSLRTWLRDRFFKDVHRQMYEGRPIHWPLSSERRTFVAWITIHRMDRTTLPAVLTEHVRPALNRLEGRRDDLRRARADASGADLKRLERQLADTTRAHDELLAFRDALRQCADKGPPPPKRTTPPRRADAPYDPVLDDGVMINSAALWPLLDPQWKAPRKWWDQLARAKGRKDYDWSHLARRHFPARVDDKCHEDPSLAVAHGCFWAYHPDRAWAWELRLRGELDPTFLLDEPPYTPPEGPALPDARTHRRTWLTTHLPDALDAVETELARRRRKQDKGTPLHLEPLPEPDLWQQPDAARALQARVAAMAETWGVEVAVGEVRG